MLPVPFALERWFAEHEFSASHLLSSSDCEALALDDVVNGFDDELRARWRSLKLGYTESRGLPLLRQEIAALQECDVDDVLCVVPEEGVLLALSALVKPGMKVVVTAPAYQSLVEVVKHAGGRVVPWHPKEAGASFCFSPATLEKLVAGAGLVVVNFPHNPTGALPDEATWRRIVDVVTASGARLFSDEMYRGLELKQEQPLPSASSLSSSAVALSGLSKSLSAPGLRAGWLCTRDRALLDDLAARKDWTTICAPGPAELLAVAVLRRRHALGAQNRARVRANIDVVTQWQAAEGGAAASGFSFFAPSGGSVGLLKVPGSADDFARKMVKERSALFVPSTLFACPFPQDADRYVRLGLGRATFADSFRLVMTATRLRG